MRTRIRRSSATRFIAAASIASALAVAAVSAPAAGQDALGSGDALDANLSTRSRSNAPTNRTDYRARNLLVTNDVAGGRGFRGSVGYEAAGDFSGRLGSNDLFSFRAGSAYSDPSLIQFGNAYTQLRLGSAAGPIEYRRSGYAPGVYEMQSTTSPMIERTGDVSTRAVLDRISSERITTNQSLSATPQAVGVVYDNDGQPNVVESSPLRGLIMRPYGEPAEDAGQGTVLGRAAMRGDRGERDADFNAARRQDVAAPFATLRINERDETMDDNASARIDRSDAGSRVETSAARPHDAYARVLQRVVDRYANVQNVDMHMDESMLRQLGIEYDLLRNQLTLAEPGTDSPRTNDPLDPNDPRADRPGDTSPQEGDDRTALLRPMGDAALEQFQVILNHDAVIESLVGAELDRFNEIMAEGEQRLRVGEFFLAERTFERALRMVRGHPLATAGYGHAQLGAGLYRSAHHTLRTLLTEHPAMIDVRYQPGLVPNRIRLLNTVAKLEQRLEEEDFDRDLNGFIIAYVGHQIEDRGLVMKGLEAMQQANASDPLAPVLRSVWLAEDTVDDAIADDDAAAMDGDGGG